LGNADSFDKTIVPLKALGLKVFIWDST